MKKQRENKGCIKSLPIPEFMAQYMHYLEEKNEKYGIETAILGKLHDAYLLYELAHKSRTDQDKYLYSTIPILAYVN